MFEFFIEKCFDKLHMISSLSLTPSTLGDRDQRVCTLTDVWTYLNNRALMTQNDNLHEGCHHMTRHVARTPPFPRGTQVACAGNMSTNWPTEPCHHHGYLVTTTWQFCPCWPTESSVHCPVHTLNGLVHCDLRSDKLWECWKYWTITYSHW